MHAELGAEDVEHTEHSGGRVARVGPHDQRAGALLDERLELRTPELVARVEHVVGIADARDEPRRILLEHIAIRVGLALSSPRCYRAVLCRRYRECRHLGAVEAARTHQRAHRIGALEIHQMRAAANR